VPYRIDEARRELTMIRIDHASSPNAAAIAVAASTFTGSSP
jgi:hypothetical protein